MHPTLESRSNIKVYLLAFEKKKNQGVNLFQGGVEALHDLLFVCIGLLECTRTYYLFS